MHGRARPRATVLRLLGAVLLAVAFVPAASAQATWSGRIVDARGAAVAGALVTARDAGGEVAESAYSDARGRFALRLSLVASPAQVRVRRAYFEDVTLDVGRGAPLPQRIALVSLSDPRAISESLPAAFHFGRIAFRPESPFSRDRFQRDCLSCHQLGNLTTRGVRSVDSWADTISRMHKYLGNFDAELRLQRARLLAEAFDGRPLDVRPAFPFDPQVARARITEYRLAGTLLPHDAEVSPVDGRVYIADQFGDQIGIVDLATGRLRLKPAPPDGGTLGGKFARLGVPALGDAASRLYRGPHSLAIGPDGRWYTTDTFATRIGVFDPKTDAWQASYEIPDGATPSLYPHTIRFDRHGLAWFTIAFSEQVGRLDPVTREVRVIQLPPGKSLGVAAGTVPYGIDVNPIDGSVWYARLWADRIGRIDPETLAVTEYDSPVRGPRRLRFDARGTLWIAGYSEGMLARVETAGFRAKVYPLPEFAPGDRPAPYAVGIDPRTQQVWVNETMTDHLYRFDPKTERWTAYPLPLRGSYTREISFTRDGRVCTSNNPFPAGALEGGVPELLCLEADARH
jgi:streptogramin lyase